MSEASASRITLKAKSVHIALRGAPCELTLPRYFGSQPSREPWYSVRDDPAIAVMIAMNRPRIIKITKICVTALPPPTMLPKASPTPVPSTMPDANMPDWPNTPWKAKGIRK